MEDFLIVTNNIVCSIAEGGMWIAGAGFSWMQLLFSFVRISDV